MLAFAALLKYTVVLLQLVFVFSVGEIYMQILDTVFTYVVTLFEVIIQTLWLDPAVWDTLNNSGMRGWLVAGVVFLAGVSTLLGQSVILFVNRVRKGRFFFSLAVNGLLYIFQFLVWGVVISLVARFLFQATPPAGTVVLLIGLSTAPYVLGFLVLMPYLGPFIGKVLNVWVFLLQVVMIEGAFGVEFIPGLISVGLGWLVMLLMTNTIGKPVIALRNKIWQKVTGTSMDVTAQDILLQFSGAGAASQPSQGGQQ